MPIVTTSNSVVATSGNATASITVAGAADKQIELRQLVWSYGGTPASGNLIVSAGTSKVLDLDIASGNVGSLTLDGLMADTGDAVTVTLGSGTSVIGKLNAYWRQR